MRRGGLSRLCNVFVARRLLILVPFCGRAGGGGSRGADETLSAASSTAMRAPFFKATVWVTREGVGVALTRLGGFTCEGKTPESELNADSGVEIVDKMKIFKRESPLSRLQSFRKVSGCDVFPEKRHVQGPAKMMCLRSLHPWVHPEPK